MRENMLKRERRPKPPFSIKSTSDYCLGWNLAGTEPPTSHVVPASALQVGVQVILRPRTGAGAGSAFLNVAVTTPVAAVTSTLSTTLPLISVIVEDRPTLLLPTIPLKSPFSLHQTPIPVMAGLARLVASCTLARSEERRVGKEWRSRW